MKYIIILYWIHNNNKIVSMKYSKILGIMLAFQLYEYTLESTEVRYDDIDGKLMKGDIM